MSFKIELELPISTVLSIHEAARAGDDEGALQIVHTLADQALLNTVKQLPYDITSGAEAHTGGIRVVNRRGTTSTAASTEATETMTAGQDEITIYVKSLTGQHHELITPINATIDELKNALVGLTGIPKVNQRFLYAGQQLEDGKCMDDASRFIRLKIVRN